MCLIVLYELFFLCNTHLTMSQIVLFFTIFTDLYFHIFVAYGGALKLGLLHQASALTIKSYLSDIATNYCPMYFHLIIVLCNKAWIFFIQLTGSILPKPLLPLFALATLRPLLCCLCLCRLPLLGFSVLPLLGFSVILFVMLSVGWLCCSLVVM